MKKGLEFYKSVSVTDPKMVKKAKRNGVKIDSIDPQYQLEQATKAFDSLYGSNWGIRDTSITTREYGTTEIMTLHGVFYYPNGQFPYSVSGKSKFVPNGKDYDMIDEDIEKKLYTNFRSKCLSQLGFNSDIYQNKFADQAYLNEAFAQNELCSPTQQQELRKMLGYYKIEAGIVNEHFIISTMAELPASNYNQAVAFIKQMGVNKGGNQ